MDEGFKDLDWSKITSLTIRYYPDDSLVAGFEFFDLDNKSVLKLGRDGDACFLVKLRKGDRVVGIEAHRDDTRFHNFRFVIMGPL